MKTCATCTREAADEQPTCAHCGEASWSDAPAADKAEIGGKAEGDAPATDKKAKRARR